MEVGYNKGFLSRCCIVDLLTQHELCCVLVEPLENMKNEPNNTHTPSYSSTN